LNKEQFNEYWIKHYPESFPIDYKLRDYYPDRWLRIHSLPESKQYADTKEEYDIILGRQNYVISGLIEENSEIIIVTGLFELEDSEVTPIEFSEYGNFTKCASLELHKIFPEENEFDFFYDVYISNFIWEKNSINKLLKDIADNKLRAMIVSPSGKCIVHPYDGGMDIIVETQEKRDELKIEYEDWLSEREDGM